MANTGATFFQAHANTTPILADWMCVALAVSLRRMPEPTWCLYCFTEHVGGLKHALEEAGYTVEEYEEAAKRLLAPLLEHE